MGLRSAGLASWAFSSVRLGPERVLVQADGLSYAQRFLNERRLEMCCWALGRMRSLFEAVTMDLSTRIRFRLPLIEMQNDSGRGRQDVRRPRDLAHRHRARA